METEQSIITRISWGKIEVSIGDRKFSFKDCKVWPGVAKEWNWKLTGTQHVPGIQPSDIEEILNQNVEVMILSRGMQLVLRTCKETEELLKSRNIKYHIEETSKAVELFNKLTNEGKRVGGVFHSTC